MDFEAASDLWRKPPTRAWERVGLPHVFDVVVDKAGAVWASVGTSTTEHSLVRAR